MTVEKEWVLPQGSLYYELNGEEAVITGLSGAVNELQIPERLEGAVVTGIARKAFLSKKQLRSIVLPATLKELGDWAFAYCSRLEEVVLPEEPLILGKAPFLECGNLKLLAIGGGDKERSGRMTADEERFPAECAELLATAVRVFEAYYLLEPSQVGNAEWLAKWDARLKAYLRADDYEGYSKQVLCGEEDYGSTDLEAFLTNKRKGKVRMCYLRLLNSVGLTDWLRTELEQYLLGHEKESWEVILKEFGEERRYYQLFAEVGCLKDDNFDRVIGEIGEAYPEMKAYFLKMKEESIGYVDFFDTLSLDL